MPTKEQRQFKRFFLSRWFLLIALGAAVFVAVAYGRAYYSDYQVRQEITRLQAEVKKLEAKKLETMEILKYVQSGAFVEEKARTELNMQKPGEQVTVIGGSAVSNTSGQSETDMVKSYNISNPLKWWKFFWNN